jgi:DNA-binding MarR family transcriptional regulator
MQRERAGGADVGDREAAHHRVGGAIGRDLGGLAGLADVERAGLHAAATAVAVLHDVGDLVGDQVQIGRGVGERHRVAERGGPGAERVEAIAGLGRADMGAHVAEADPERRLDLGQHRERRRAARGGVGERVAGRRRGHRAAGAAGDPIGQRALARRGRVGRVGRVVEVERTSARTEASVHAGTARGAADLPARATLRAGMDLNEIVVFAKVVETKSFTAAAQQLGLPKSTVSRKVSQLEERLDARLLQRTTRKLSLTEIGQAYYERCQRIVADIAAAEQLVDDLQATPRGRLKVTAPVDLGAFRLGELTAQFLALHPDIDASRSTLVHDLRTLNHDRRRVRAGTPATETIDGEPGLPVGFCIS